MGCIATTQKTVKDNKSVKSHAQLEYELNNCYDHFHTVSITMQRSQRYIFKSVGKELNSKEYYEHYLKIESDATQNKLVESFDIFFKAVEQGLSLLPLILKQIIKLEITLKDKKKEITEFRQSIITHIDFCKHIILPSHMGSQSTEY